MRVQASLIKIGGSRGVILPAIWFKQIENEQESIETVEMEIGDNITIIPIRTKVVVSDDLKPSIET